MTGMHVDCANEGDLVQAISKVVPGVLAHCEVDPYQNMCKGDSGKYSGPQVVADGRWEYLVMMICAAWKWHFHSCQACG